MSGADDAVHEWDAAYVLGALSPDDRRLFERHLAECPECRASVSGLAGLPALLARVPASDALALDVEDESADRVARSANNDLPAGLLPSLAHRVRRRRRVRRWVLAGAAVIVAAAIAAAVVLPTELGSRVQEAQQGTQGTQVTLAQTVPNPLTATVSVTHRDWGTELAMTCRYASTPSGYATTGHFALYVTDAAGHATRVASWAAWPGVTIHASGAVDLAKAQLRTVEIRDTTTDAVLLSSPVK